LTLPGAVLFEAVVDQSLTAIFYLPCSNLGELPANELLNIGMAMPPAFRTLGLPLFNICNARALLSGVNIS
tara:strand:+ start:422 stop:634 length:213 start_codon:yes stop_codon:yes gene_type:complete